MTSPPSTSNGASSCWRSAVCSAGALLGQVDLLAGEQRRRSTPAGCVAAGVGDEQRPSCRASSALLRPVGEPIVPGQRQAREALRVGARTARRASVPASARRWSRSACQAADGVGFGHGRACAGRAVGSRGDSHGRPRSLRASIIDRTRGAQTRYNPMRPALLAARDRWTPRPTRICRCKEDTRLLGRLLGDVLRAQTGEEGFARIEAIRQTAIRFRRAAPARRRRRSRRELARLLNGLPIAADARRRARVQLFLAPREHRRGRAPEPAAPRARAWPDRRRSGQHRRTRSTGCAKPASTRRTVARLVCRRAGEPGAHRASDRGAAQEHPRLRARDRAPAAMARPRRSSRPTSSPRFDTRARIGRCSRCGRRRCCALRS